MFARRAQVMGGLWALVERAELSGEACGWLERRGIRPEVAWGLGARDWAVCAREVGAYLDGLCEGDRVAAGLAREKEPGEPGPKAWAGCEALDADSWARGVCLGLMHPGYPGAPLAWRLRVYAPFSTPRGQGPKALAQYAGTPALPALPLGLVPARTSSPGPARAPIYLMCEGEPDWLSVADVLGRLGPELARPVHPIGLVTMSSGYPYEFMPMLSGAHRVICLFDRGPMRGGMSGGQRAIEKLRGGLMHQRRVAEPGLGFEAVYEAVGAQLVGALQDDEADLNDLHTRGALRPLLERLLQEAG